MPNDANLTLSVLAVLPQRADRSALARIFSHTRWKLDACGTLTEAHSHLRDGNPGVVVCDSVLPEGDWRDLLNELQAHETVPRLIVAMPTVDDQLWAELINLGGYDALVKPFYKEEVVRLVSLAWLSWKDAHVHTAPEPKPAQIHSRNHLAAVAS